MAIVLELELRSENIVYLPTLGNLDHDKGFYYHSNHYLGIRTNASMRY